MSKRFGLMFAIAAGVLLQPGDASASTKCLCNNGVVTHSMQDGGDEVCRDACDSMGGGRVWQTEDAAYTDDGTTINTNPAARAQRRQQRQPPGR